MWRTDQVGTMQHTYGHKHSQCTQYLHKEVYLHSATHDLHTSNSHLRASKWQDVHGQLSVKSKSALLQISTFLNAFQAIRAISNSRINLMEQKKRGLLQLSSVTKRTGGGFSKYEEFIVLLFERSISGFLMTSQ